MKYVMWLSAVMLCVSAVISTRTTTSVSTVWFYNSKLTNSFIYENKNVEFFYCTELNVFCVIISVQYLGKQTVIKATKMVRVT